MTIKKVHTTLSKLYSKKLAINIESAAVVGYDGHETYIRNNKKFRPVYNEDILVYLEASGFGLTAQDVRMTRISTYHGYGSQVRISIYAEQTVLFVAK